MNVLQTNKVLRKIVLEISEELNIPEKVIEKAVMSQFKIVRDTISEAKKGDDDTFKNIYLQYLGKFAAKPGRLKHFKRILNDI